MRLTFLFLLLAATAAEAAPDASAYDLAVVRVVTTFEPVSDEGAASAGGSGFFINNRYIVTNHHVVDSSRSASGLFILSSGSTDPLPVTLLWSDAGLDLALLDAAGRMSGSSLELAGENPSVGMEVFAVGYPGSADAVLPSIAARTTLTDGILSKAPFDAQWGVGGGGRRALVLQHTAAISPGNSGGALLDTCGGVLGVNTSGGTSDVRDADGNVVGATSTQGIFFALSASELRSVLDQLGVSYSVAEACRATSTLAPIGLAFSPSATVHPLTIAVLVAILAAVTVLLFRRPRQVVATTAGRSVSAVAGALEAVSVQDAGVRGSVRFAGLDGSPDLGLSTEALVRAPHGLSVGRHPGLVDRPLDIQRLSRRHFRISIHRGRAFVEDLNSANGTFVNGTRLEPYRGRQLRTGDVIDAGEGHWQFNAPE